MSKEYYAPMHTAEHVLNQTMVRMFNCGRSFSNHIEKKKSKCDYHFSRNLTAEEILAIEQNVNSVLSSGLEVREEFIDRNIAENLFDLVRLPDESGDRIRIIRIGDYDACPCSGNHVTNTSEVSDFKIISTSFEDNILRIRFRIEGK
jgi:Ser-tRNA(Ala) deacylase AlaX